MEDKLIAKIENDENELKRLLDLVEAARRRLAENNRLLDENNKRLQHKMGCVLRDNYISGSAGIDRENALVVEDASRALSTPSPFLWNMPQVSPNAEGNSGSLR